MAALALTKVNVGGYAPRRGRLPPCLPGSHCSRRWLRRPAIAVLLLLPFLIMSPDLREEWVRELVLLELSALAAIAIAATPPRPLPRESDQSLRAGCSPRWPARSRRRGGAGDPAPDRTDLSERLFDGIVTQGLKLREAFMIPLTLPRAAVAGGILAVACAGLGIWLRAVARHTTIYPGALACAVGLTIWFTVSAPLSLNPTGNPIVLPMALAWVAAFAPAGSEEPPFARFARIFLPLLR